MKKMKRKIPLIFLILLYALCMTSIKAQNLSIYDTTGSIKQIAINDVQSLKFTGNTININNNNGISETKNIDGIQKMTFDELLSKIIESRNNFIQSSVIYPNPSNGIISIFYTLQNAGPVEISIYNYNGLIVKQLKYDIQVSGSYTYQMNIFDAENNSFSSGIYFCKITTANSIFSNKIIITK